MKRRTEEMAKESLFEKIIKLPVTGIDVGSRTVRGIRLKKTRGKVYVDQWFLTDLAEGNPSFPSSTDAGRSLKAQIEIHGLANARAATALVDSDVTSFELLLPKMPAKEMEQAVKFEVSQRMRVPEEELSIDYDVDPREVDGQYTVAVHCTKRALVSETISLLSDSGLRPLSIESRMQANVETLFFNEDASDSGCYAIVDLGEATTSMGFLVAGTLKAVFVEHVGCGLMNQQLQEKLNIDYLESEKRKLAYSFSDASTFTSNEQEAIEKGYVRIFKAIKDTLENFVEMNPGLKVDKVFLTGGGSRREKIHEVTQSFFGISCAVINPFKNIELYSPKLAKSGEMNGELAKVACHMTTAVGLALRGVA